MGENNARKVNACKICLYDETKCMQNNTKNYIWNTHKSTNRQKDWFEDGDFDYI